MESKNRDRLWSVRHPALTCSGGWDEGGFRHETSAFLRTYLNPLMVDVSSIDFAELNPLVMARVGMLNYNERHSGPPGSEEWRRHLDAV